MNQTAESRHPLLGLRLSKMMFLQYAVWGAWLPIVGRYLGSETRDGGLGFSGAQIGTIIGTAGAVGAVTAPFIAGQVADRYFSAERFLALLMLLGAGVMWMLAGQTEYSAWLGLSVVYSVIYMPTISLSNSLAFSWLEHPDSQFPKIRLWGTIGWIAVSWVFPMAWLQTGLELQAMPPFLVGTEIEDVGARLSDALRLSAILSALYGVYCLTLPHTPPKRSVESLAVVEAFRMLGKRGMLVVTIVALPISILHTIYFIQTSQFLPTLPGVRVADVQPAMTIGQFSEIFILGFLGLMLVKFGFRWVMTLGAACYCLRYAAFALGTPTGFVVTSQALHGFCFSCFYAAAFIYVERVSRADVRHSAQTVFGIIVLGLGPLLSGVVVGQLTAFATRDATLAECLATPNLVPNEPPAEEGGWGALDPRADEAMAAYAEANERDAARAWQVLPGESAVTALDYRRFWGVAALIGLACAVALALFFRLDPPGDEEDARRFAETS